MKNRAMIPLAIGLVVGLVAVKFSVDVVKSARAASGNDQLLRVVVAQQSIPMGVEIKPSMLSVSKTGKALAPEGCFQEPAKLTGRVAKSPILKGMPVIEEMLAAPGTPAGMASLVPAGYRAVAVKVDEYSSVGGFLKPGCRVDVAAVMSIKNQTGSSETISRVILQDVTIGAVGQSLTGEGDTSAANVSHSVTLLVKPEEVPILHLAATQGQIRLAMRHYEDSVNGTTNCATDKQLAPELVKTPEKESFLSGLAKLLQSQQPKTTPRPDWANQEAGKSKPVNVAYPHIMTVISGSAVQTIAFENNSSAHRVELSSFKGESAAMASADSHKSDPARTAPVEQDQTTELPRGQ